jgi:hypothetical protein
MTETYAEAARRALVACEAERVAADEGLFEEQLPGLVY